MAYQVLGLLWRSPSNYCWAPMFTATAVTPAWNDIGHLAAIAALHTTLIFPGKRLSATKS